MANNMEMLLDPFAYKIRLNRPVRDPKRLDHGWRTDMLAIPKGNKEELALFSLSPSEVAHYRRVKQELMDRDDTTARRRMQKRINDILARHITDLSLMPLRVYTQQRKEWKGLCGKKFENRMKKYIDQTRTSVYLEYAHARAKLKKEGKGPYAKLKTKAKKGKVKKRTNKEIRAAAFEKLAKFATAKKPPKPSKINRGKHGQVNEAILDKLQTPKYVTHKFVDDSNAKWRTEHFVPEKALTFQPTVRIMELATPLVRLVNGPVQLDDVENYALTYKATPRIIELAIPKKHDAVQEAVINEDIFKVSENAMHYKASERIIELAKPKVRD